MGSILRSGSGARRTGLGTTRSSSAAVSRTPMTRFHEAPVRRLRQASDVLGLQDAPDRSRTLRARPARLDAPRGSL